MHTGKTAVSPEYPFQSISAVTFLNLAKEFPLYSTSI